MVVPDRVRVPHRASCPRLVVERAGHLVAKQQLTPLEAVPDAGDDPGTQLRSLGALAARLSQPGAGWLADAVGSYLDLVQSAIEKS